MLRSARLFAPSLALFAGAGLFGLGGFSFARGIVSPPSPLEASSFAAPFLLFAAGGLASFALGASELSEALAKSRASSRSRSRLA